MGDAPRSYIQVATPVVHGVQLRRHQLDLQASRLTNIAARLGRRIRYQFIAMTDEKELPSQELRECIELHASITLRLLTEQRLRAQLAAKEPSKQITDAEFHAQLRQLALDTVAGMSDAEFVDVLSARGQVINASVRASDSEDDEP